MFKQHLAQLNLSQLAAPLDSPQLQGFVSRIEPIYALAERAPGFIWRLVSADDNVVTRLFGPGLIQNLSVWESVEALRDFVTQPDHLAALRQRREWFRRMTTPHVVLWWIEAGHRPDLREAAARLTLLRRRGPTAAAFPPPAWFASNRESAQLAT